MFSGPVEHLKNFIQIIAFNSDTIISDSNLGVKGIWLNTDINGSVFFPESWYFTALLIILLRDYQQAAFICYKFRLWLIFTDKE